MKKIYETTIEYPLSVAAMIISRSKLVFFSPESFPSSYKDSTATVNETDPAEGISFIKDNLPSP